MDTVKHIEADQRGLNRRGFLRASAGGLAALASVLALRQPPSRHSNRS